MARGQRKSLTVIKGGQPDVVAVDLGELPVEPQPVWLFWTVMNMLWPAGELATDQPQGGSGPRRRAPQPAQAGQASK